MGAIVAGVVAMAIGAVAVVGIGVAAEVQHDQSKRLLLVADSQQQNLQSLETQAGQQAQLLAICVQLGLFCLALAFVADGVAAATGRRAIGIAVSAGYTFVSYIVYGLAATIHWLRPVRPLTLWRWYLGGDPLGSGFDGWGLVVLAVTCLVALGAGAAAFSHRDVHA